MPHQKEGKVFFILAVLIMLIGHQFLIGDNFLTGAGATKTTTSKTTSTSPSKTTTDTTATEKTTTDSTITTEKTTTTTDTTASKTTTDTTTKTEIATTEKTAIPTTTEKTPLIGKAAAYAETKTITTRTEKEAVVVKEFTPTKIVLENKGTAPLALTPALKFTSSPVPSEENLARLVREKILKEEGLISAQELLLMVEKKVAGIKAIEKANVKPLYVRKIYRPFEMMTGRSVSDITYTGQATAGELLSPQLLDVSAIMLQPQRQATIDLALREPLAIEEQTVEISFSSQGQEVVSSKLRFPKSKTRTAIDPHPERQLFDLYLVINPMDLEKKGENYYVEIVLEKGNKVLYFELLGPYTVKSTEPALFSQEFRYPTQYAGEYVLTATIYRDTQRIIRQEHRVNLG